MKNVNCQTNVLNVVDTNNCTLYNLSVICKGVISMVVKERLREGLFLIFIYLIVTFFLFMAADRVERLDKEEVDSSNVTTLEIQK